MLGSLFEIFCYSITQNVFFLSGDHCAILSHLKAMLKKKNRLGVLDRGLTPPYIGLLLLGLFPV